MLVFEDLHWADDALLAFLEHVVEYADRRPAARGRARPGPSCSSAHRRSRGGPQLHRDRPGSAVRGRDRATHRRAAGQAVLPAEVQHAILDRAGGNPLYAEEFVRLLKDRGSCRRDGADLACDAGAPRSRCRPVQALIAARLDTLSPERKRLLQDAAVLGKVFWAARWRRWATRDPAEVDAGPARARRARSSSAPARAPRWRARPSTRSGTPWCATCATADPPLARVERHTSAAALDRVGGRERLEDLAEILAGHYTAALELARRHRSVGGNRRSCRRRTALPDARR